MLAHKSQHYKSMLRFRSEISWRTRENLVLFCRYVHALPILLCEVHLAAQKSKMAVAGRPLTLRREPRKEGEKVKEKFGEERSG